MLFRQLVDRFLILVLVSQLHWAERGAAATDSSPCLAALEAYEGRCLFGCEDSLPVGATFWIAQEKPRPLSLTIYNIGGEGEFAVRDQVVVNIQLERIAANPDWRSSRHSMAMPRMIELGKRYNQIFYFVSDMTQIPGRSGVVDLIYTNSIPLDTVTHLGPAPTREQIATILREGGLWVHNQEAFVKRNGVMIPFP